MKLIETLLPVPPAALSAHCCAGDGVFATSDPPGRQLGSGGGTAHLLHEAWKASGVPTFREWLRRGRKLVIHGSGQSRRLPDVAILPLYAAHRLPELLADEKSHRP